jgi:hypothetical protein
MKGEAVGQVVVRAQFAKEVLASMKSVIAAAAWASAASRVSTRCCSARIADRRSAARPSCCPGDVVEGVPMQHEGLAAL